jgi:RNA polymerase sigma factor (sigma-70 family)
MHSDISPNCTVPGRQQSLFRELLDEIDEIRLLLKEVGAGNKESALKLVAKYGDSIRRAVRRVISMRMRPEFDSLDFVQDVWQVVFKTPGRLAGLESPAALVAYLTAIARNKVISATRHRFGTGKNRGDREHASIENSQSGKDAGEVPDGRPEAIDVMIATETLEGLLSKQPPLPRKIIALRLEGFTDEQIARLLHMTRSAVHEFFRRLSRKHREGRI